MVNYIVIICLLIQIEGLFIPARYSFVSNR